MSITTFYRLCIWLPIIVPADLIVVVDLFGLRDVVGYVGEAVGFSLWIGGIPYTALGAWATWWVGGRTEPEIRRLMFRAPLLMVAAFVPLALLVGFAIGVIGPYVAVAALGSVVIILLGYTCVGLTALLRPLLGSQLRGHGRA